MFDEFVPRVCVVGLGYVGLPLAVEFAKNGVEVRGFDVDGGKIAALKNDIDECGQFSAKELADVEVIYSQDPSIIGEANFVIVAVPTPIDRDKGPDLSFLEKASKMVGENLCRGTVVVYESTVYPGVTEEVCLPILEKASGMKCGEDFFIGYSPERVNPGDKEHTIDKIVKVIAGMNEDVAGVILKVYSVAIKAGVFKAKDIKTAEASKVIENVQRDLNIALVNELALIFSRMGINTHDVIEAAGTKWNFHKYHPGLVGGHCIGVDPYYLVFKAQRLGYYPRLLMAARTVNESMADFVAESLIKMMIGAEKKIRGAKVLLLGLTFKENVNDVRNSKARDIIDFLKSYGVEVMAFEPHVSRELAREEFGVENLQWSEAKDLDGVILVNGHKSFESISLEELKKKSKEKPALFDLKNFFEGEEAQRLGFLYASL